MKKIFFLSLPFIALTASLILASTTTLFVPRTTPLHVNSTTPVNGPGFSWWPQKNLLTAINLTTRQTTSPKAIILHDIHEGVFVFPSEITITSTDTAEIIGSLEIGTDTTLTGFRISGPDHGITTRENSSDIVLHAMDISDNEGDGIHTMDGAQFTITESTFHRNKKGLYIRKGSSITLSDSSITSNREEGVDLRFDVDADIHDNTITQNGEVGIEYILGGSSGKVHDNIISNNIKSGIAFQYYETAPDLGNISVRDNAITNNGRFGIKCVQTRSGKRPSGYFRNSLSLDGNIFDNNSEKSIAKKCL